MYQTGGYQTGGRQANTRKYLISSPPVPVQILDLQLAQVLNFAHVSSPLQTFGNMSFEFSNHHGFSLVKFNLRHYGTTLIARATA
jgi:hypothetical protein